MQIERIMHFASTKEPISTQSGKNKSLYDINKISDNTRSRILETE